MKRNGQLCIYPQFFKIMDCQFHLDPLCRTRHGRSRSASRGVSTGSSALVGALEGEEPTPGGEGGAGGRQPQVIFLGDSSDDGGSSTDG